MWNLLVFLLLVACVIGVVCQTVAWIRWRLGPFYQYSRPLRTTDNAINKSPTRQASMVGVPTISKTVTDGVGESLDESVENSSDSDYDPDMGNGRGPGYGGCCGM